VATPCSVSITSFFIIAWRCTHGSHQQAALHAKARPARPTAATRRRFNLNSRLVQFCHEGLGVVAGSAGAAYCVSAARGRGRGPCVAPPRPLAPAPPARHGAPALFLLLKGPFSELCYRGSLCLSLSPSLALAQGCSVSRSTSSGRRTQRRARSPRRRHWRAPRWRTRRRASCARR
jgi:hypothetical protein